MPTNATPQPTPNDPSEQYGPVFARYLAGALRQSLSQVQAHRYTVPEDVRTQAWHILRMTLGVDALWEQTSELLIELAPRMEMAGFRQDWIPFLDVGIARGEMLRDESSQAKLFYYLGQLHRMMGQYDEALSYLNTSEEIFCAQNEVNDQAVVCNEKAFITFQQGDYAATTALAHKAISLFYNEHSEIGMSYYHLGSVALATSKHKEARMFYRKALDIRRRHSDLRRIAANLRNLGNIDRSFGQYEQAIDQYQQAMKIHTDYADPAQLAITQIALGIVYRRTSKFQNAIDSYANAELIFKSINDHDNLAVVYNNMGLVYKDMGRLNQACQLLYLSIEIREKVDNPLLLADTMEELGKIYSLQGRYRTALSTFKEALKCINDVPNITSLEIYKSLNGNVEKLSLITSMRM